MTAPTIVFDLDGTLIDTAPDLVDTLNVVFAREGWPPVPYETARKLIGGGARTMIARGIEAEGIAIAPAKLERLFADFIAHYTEHIADRSRPFPGLTDALDALAVRRLPVCRLHQQARTIVGAAAQAAQTCRPLRGDLRTGHVRHAEARPGGTAAHHRGGRRKPAAIRS